MQTIHPGHQKYLFFFPEGNISEETTLRPSFFLLRQDVEEGTLLCNTLTGELVLLSGSEVLCLDSLHDKALPVIRCLVRHRFIVPVSANEAASAEQLRYLMLKKLSAKKTISVYNILPTTFCNARCFYCYEYNLKHVHMTKETAEQLVHFIADHHGNESVVLQWFGGEPTIAHQQIDMVCDQLRMLGIEFISKMTSNAYLFDETLVFRAKNKWNLQGIQVTLDGTEAVYNLTKAYVGIHDNPYQRVLRNIQLLINAGIHVTIRLNLDNHNLDDLLTLADELSSRFIDRKYLSVYVAKLDEEVGFYPIHHTKNDLEILDMQIIRIREKLEQNGWPQYRMKMLPELHVSYCMADNPNAIQCAPDGVFSRCLNHIYTHAAGSLENGLENNEMLFWQQRQAFDGCEQCPLYPSCERLLKNCPVMTARCDEYDRQRRIARYKEIMLEEYEKWK